MTVHMSRVMPEGFRRRSQFKSELDVLRADWGGPYCDGTNTHYHAPKKKPFTQASRGWLGLIVTITDTHRFHSEFDRRPSSSP